MFRKISLPDPPKPALSPFARSASIRIPTYKSKPLPSASVAIPRPANSSNSHYFKGRNFESSSFPTRLVSPSPPTSNWYSRFGHSLRKNFFKRSISMSSTDSDANHNVHNLRNVILYNRFQLIFFHFIFSYQWQIHSWKK